MWSLAVRKKYEDQIIVRFKNPPQAAARAAGGHINLGTTESAEEIQAEDDDALQAAPAVADPVPESDPDEPKAEPKNNPATLGARRGNKSQQPRRGLDQVKAISEASTPTKESQVIEEE
jgi:hypothetical protein